MSYLQSSIEGLSSRESLDQDERIKLNLFIELQRYLPRFWKEGIVEAKFPFLTRLGDVLCKEGLSLECLIKSGDIYTIARYIVNPEGLNYGFLPKALMYFHSYPGNQRLALEEQIRAAISLLGSSSNYKIHFVISPEHESFFSEALNQLKNDEDFGEFLRYFKASKDRLPITWSFQDPSTDTVALDLVTGNLAKNEQDHPILRKAGHGALIKNLNGFRDHGIFIQNIDNIVYQEGALPALINRYKQAMAGLAFEIHDEIQELKAGIQACHSSSAPLDNVLKELVSYFRRKLLIELDLLDTKSNPQSVLAKVSELLERPIVIAGYVPLAPGQIGGGPFIEQEEFDGDIILRKVSTYEGSEFPGGQKNPNFQNGEFFNPVNLFIHPNGIGDFSNCVDLSRAFSSIKFDSQGRQIKAYELPGLWNGSLSKVLQISVALPIKTFAPVKDCAGAESFLNPLHQMAVDEKDVFAEIDYIRDVIRY